MYALLIHLHLFTAYCGDYRSYIMSLSLPSLLSKYYSNQLKAGSIVSRCKWQVVCR